MVTASAYPFNKEHEREWTLNGTYDENTPIARAWARMYDKGILLGHPLTDAYDVGKGIMRQVFNHAYGDFDTNVENNPNKATVFYDARGVVGTESGL